MDPVAASAVLKVGEKVADAAAKEAGSVLSRLFGPSADVMGAHWAEQLRENNLARLLKKTEKRAQGTANPGFTNPRVAAQAFESASYADDEFVAEYLSGVLSSSRTNTGKDDSGLAWTSVVARLPALALRMHYVLYDAVRRGAIDRGVTDVPGLPTLDHIVDLDAVVKSF